jgi:hypothetical protein
MNENQLSELNEFLKSGEYLPIILQDFHDQKNLFKSMHHLYQDNPSAERAPNWIDGQIYTVDWFLWFMASRGYTLQKSRKKMEFREIPDFRELVNLEQIIPAS